METETRRDSLEEESNHPLREIPGFYDKFFKRIGKAEKFLKRSLRNILIGYVAFYTTAFITKGIEMSRGHFLTENELEKMLTEEKSKLRIKEEVNLTFSEKSKAHSWKKGEKYFVELGGYGKTRGSLRHELYHIHRGHLESGKLNILKYFLIQEPQCILYEHTSLKL